MNKNSNSDEGRDPTPDNGSAALSPSGPLLHETTEWNQNRQLFHTTSWSIVIAAGQESSSVAKQALSTLCEAYWYPLYAYARRQGRQHVEAEDLTQAFFVHLLEQDRIQVADQTRGRFRTFLLTSFRNFMNNQYRNDGTQKRGGGKQVLSLDFDKAHHRFENEPSYTPNPDREFERRWALALIAKAMERLEQEYSENDRSNSFQHLKLYLGGSSDRVPYDELAEKLNMTGVAVKVAVHRLRKRCQKLLREEILQTVADESEVETELQHLFEALRN